LTKLCFRKVGRLKTEDRKMRSPKAKFKARKLPSSVFWLRSISQEKICT